jgi:hypothetical protein
MGYCRYFVIGKAVDVIGGNGHCRKSRACRDINGKLIKGEISYAFVWQKFNGFGRRRE